MTCSRIIVVVGMLAIAAGCKGTQKSEAEVNLERLGAVVKAKFDKAGGFPSGRVGPTPSAACCAQPDKACNDPGAWQLPLWTELGFSIPGQAPVRLLLRGQPDPVHRKGDG